MSLQRLLLQTQRRARVIAIILLLSEVIPLYSHYIKKGLVYIAIAALSSRQPSFYSGCTSANMRLSCDIRSVSNAKCTFYVRLCPTYSASGNT